MRIGGRSKRGDGLEPSAPATVLGRPPGSPDTSPEGTANLSRPGRYRRYEAAGANGRRGAHRMTEGRPPGVFISDLRPSRVATFEANVSSLETPREVETKEGVRTVRHGVLSDPTGEIGLVLWGPEVGLVQAGDRVRIVEGWVSNRRGRPQVSLGRSGRIEKVGRSP